MAVMNLESLVLRGVPVVGNVGTSLKRIGIQAAVEPASVSLSLMPKPANYPPTANPEDSRCFRGDLDASAAWAGRSRSIRLFGERWSFASSRSGVVLSERSQRAEQLRLGTKGRTGLASAPPVAAEDMRKRPPVNVLANACHAEHETLHRWQVLEKTTTTWTRFGFITGAFTASTRGRS